MTAISRGETSVLHSVWDLVDGIRVHGRVDDRALARGHGADDLGARRDVVFVHGLGMSTRYMEPTMQLLARDYAVSGLDLPGFGETTLRGRVLSLSELAALLGAWMRARDIETPILVGQSHGCQVVVEHVASTPFRGAIVLNAPTMLAGHRSVLAQLGLVARDTPREPLDLVPHVARDYLRAGPRRILSTLRDGLRDRIEEKLPRLAVPVTIVCGERDPVSPPDWNARLAQLTGSLADPRPAAAELRVVAGAAHAVPFSHPAALASAIVDTVDRLDVDPRPV